MRAPLFVIVVTLVCGCSATPYQPLNGSTVTGEGYFERQLGPDSYEVSFRGNINTSSERAIDFTLLRAAELCLLNGCSRFSVTGSQSLDMAAMSVEPSERISNNTANIVGLEVVSNTSMTTRRGAPRPTYEGTRPGYRVVVEFGEQTSEDPELIHDAESLSDAIRAKYSLKPPDDDQRDTI